MSNTPDDRLFDRLIDVLNVSAITTITSGALCRDDWAASDKPTLPRIEYNPLRYTVLEGGDSYLAQFGITALCDRSTAYGDGDTPESEGDIWTLEANILSALDGVTLSGVTGYTLSPIGLTARRRPTETPDDIVGRRLNFGIVVYPGSTVPLSGGDADLTGLSSNLKVTNWNISVDAGMNTDFTTAVADIPIIDLDRPLSIVQIRARIVGDGSYLFPAVGSRQTLTFQVASGMTWNNQVLIRRVQWVPNPDEQRSPQVAIITGVIDYGDSGVNSGSSVFTGAV